jgi:3-phosphoshikimate 1-carboxyvinyltransferase
MTPRPIDVLTWPPAAVLRIPGSKSITNRALICAALAAGSSRLGGILLADDTQVMIDGLVALGARIEVIPGESPVAVVTGRGSGISEAAVRIAAGLSGTTARFLAAVAAAVAREATIDGLEPLRARPVGDLLTALSDAGVRVESTRGRLPVRLHGGAAWAPRMEVAGDVSSQFLSGLLLAAPTQPEGLQVTVTGKLQSEPYVAMTCAVMARFGANVEVSADGRTFLVAPGGYQPADIDIEPDASAASYFFAAAAVSGGSVLVEGLHRSALQGDVGFVDCLESMGATVHDRPAGLEVCGPDRPLDGITADFAAISDTAQTLGAIAPLASGRVAVNGIGFIRAKETDRLAAVVTELRRRGVDAEDLPDGFEVHPGSVEPGVVQTYDDHRMAMSFAVLGLMVEGIQLADPGVVSKTFPDFYAVLDQLRRPSVVAIDGPAGSGKSTVARLLAKRLDLPYLDTGAMFRSATWLALQHGVDLADGPAIAQLLNDSEIQQSADMPPVVTVGNRDVSDDIRGSAVTAAVSAVSAHPEVRQFFRRQQREWTTRHGGGVVEGRDIGTVVFPNAVLKVFLTASPEVRAVRRGSELGHVADAEIAAVAADLARRDELDSSRQDSPLRPADDAFHVDSTDLDIDGVVGVIATEYEHRAGWRPRLLAAVAAQGTTRGTAQGTTQGTTSR